MPTVVRERKRETLSEPLVVRFTESEMARIVELADEQDVSQARVIRAAVKELFKRLDSDPPSPSKKKKRKK